MARGLGRREDPCRAPNPPRCSCLCTELSIGGRLFPTAARRGAATHGELALAVGAARDGPVSRDELRLAHAARVGRVVPHARPRAAGRRAGSRPSSRTREPRGRVVLEKTPSFPGGGDDARRRAARLRGPRARAAGAPPARARAGRRTTARRRPGRRTRPSLTPGASGSKGPPAAAPGRELGRGRRGRRVDRERAVEQRQVVGRRAARRQRRRRAVRPAAAPRHRTERRGAGPRPPRSGGAGRRRAVAPPVAPPPPPVAAPPPPRRRRRSAQQQLVERRVVAAEAAAGTAAEQRAPPPRAASPSRAGRACSRGRLGSARVDRLDRPVRRHRERVPQQPVVRVDDVAVVDHAVEVEQRAVRVLGVERRPSSYVAAAAGAAARVAAARIGAARRATAATPAGGRGRDLSEPLDEVVARRLGQSRVAARMRRPRPRSRSRTAPRRAAPRRAAAPVAPLARRRRDLGRAFARGGDALRDRARDAARAS